MLELYSSRLLAVGEKSVSFLEDVPLRILVGGFGVLGQGVC